MAGSALLDEVLTDLFQARGVDLSGYRRPMLDRRLNSRLAVVRLTEPAGYLERLRSDPEEYDRLLDAFSIGATSFFRNPLVWEILGNSVLPLLVEHKRAGRSPEFRMWSAGCASGEEAYSIAILAHEILRGELAGWKVHIFATDLNEGALKSATRGIYPRDRLEHTRLGIVDRYFIASAAGYEVQPFIRRMVWFSRHDLASSRRLAPAESVFGTFDLILCRNVLIYFDRDLQARVIEKLTRTLARGGWLVLGESETLPEPRNYRLTAFDRRNRIYQKGLETPTLAAQTVLVGEQHA